MLWCIVLYLAWYLGGPAVGGGITAIAVARVIILAAMKGEDT